MKSPLFLVVLAALLVSLWFHWSRVPGAGMDPVKANVPSQHPESGTAVLPAGEAAEIDFTGTGLADEAWELDPLEPEIRIPDKVPSGNEVLFTPSMEENEGGDFLSGPESGLLE